MVMVRSIIDCSKRLNWVPKKKVVGDKNANV